MVVLELLPDIVGMLGAETECMAVFQCLDFFTAAYRHQPSEDAESKPWLRRLKTAGAESNTVPLASLHTGGEG